MRLEHLDLALPAPELSAVRRFVEAVRALSDNPRSGHVERYLVASRALEDSPLEKKAAPESRGLTKGRI
jgi:hypothetical protein